MDQRRFDAIARSLGAANTRRGVLGGLVAAVAGLAGVRSASGQSPCPPGQFINRRGKCDCPAGFDECPDGCFDFKRDRVNCGSCGNFCGVNTVCQKGKCVCAAGAARCNGVCSTPGDFISDPSNCGACGVVCPDSTPFCSDGTCVACTPLSGTCALGGVPCCDSLQCIGGSCQLQ